MDIKLVNLIYESLVNHFVDIPLRKEHVFQMKPIPGDGLLVYGYQYGDLTILVHVQFQNKNGKMEYTVSKIMSQSWKSI